jgi:hypothetical protein
MEEASENGTESSLSAHANGMIDWRSDIYFFVSRLCWCSWTYVKSEAIIGMGRALSLTKRLVCSFSCVLLLVRHPIHMCVCVCVCECTIKCIRFNLKYFVNVHKYIPLHKATDNQVLSSTFCLTDIIFFFWTLSIV